MPSGDGTRAPLHRRIGNAMTDRLALKAAALFFACVLWLVVSAEEPTEQVVEVVVSPRMDSSYAIVGRRPVVRALVIGRARELIKLAGETPVVRPLVDPGARDSVRVTVRPEDVELPSGAQVLVRELRPRFVTVRVQRLAQPAPPATEAESTLAGIIPPSRSAPGALVFPPIDTLRPRPADSVQRDTTRRADSADGAVVPAAPVPAGSTSTPAAAPPTRAGGPPPDSTIARRARGAVTDSARAGARRRPAPPPRP